MTERTDLYLRLDYDDYKDLERQLKRWTEIETTHTTTAGFYHKAIRLRIGTITLEIQGPMVMRPIGADASPFADPAPFLDAGRPADEVRGEGGPS